MEYYKVWNTIKVEEKPKTISVNINPSQEARKENQP